MKKTFVTLIAVCATVISLHAFRSNQTTGIKGSILPAEATVSYVWAINGTDSIKVQPVKGSFALAVKAGTYKVVIDATDPYKDAVIEKVEVKEGQVTDLGEIKLMQ
jgi:hypothetical protein